MNNSAELFGKLRTPFISELQFLQFEGEEPTNPIVAWNELMEKGEMWQTTTIESFLKQLAPRGRLIVTHFYGLGVPCHSEQEIARLLSVGGVRLHAPRIKGIRLQILESWALDLIAQRKLPGLDSAPPEMSITRLESLDLSQRAFNCLRRRGILTIQQLAEKYYSLSSIRGFGKECLREVQSVLEPYGLIQQLPGRW